MLLFPGKTNSLYRALQNSKILWREPTPRTILVIGGAGYIGSALVAKLLARGHRVRLLDLLFYGTEPIANALENPNLEIVQADFRRIDKVVECMQGVDAVIHLGAIVGDPACALDENLTVQVNLIGTRTIADVAKRFGVWRFIFASTCSVYGASENEQLLDENTPPNPLSLYAVSKLTSERVLMEMACKTFAPTCLRFPTIYGLSGRTRFDLVVNLLTAKAVMDGQITIDGGDQWRPFLHVDDAAQSIINTMEAPLQMVRREVFNVGSDEQNYTIQQLGELIQSIVPSATLIRTPSGGDQRNYRVSFKKIRETLDFSPQWTVEQGVNQVLDVIRRGEVTDYMAAQYSNVKFLTEYSNVLTADYAADYPAHKSNWAYDLISRTSTQLPQPAVA